MFRRLIGLVFCLLASIHAWGYAQSPSVKIENANSYPELRVDGKPFFIHAAAFFYPRLPRDLWEDSLGKLKDMGINTVDLYIPWNWHEPFAGDLDFDGRTNPRRDLLGLMRMIAKLGLRAIVRPGPYICAEWKNGGYPDWLLRLPEYKMSARSILEGRYPPLSSLQYADSESAAKGWLENAAHQSHVRRWYKDVASNVIVPYSADRGGPIIFVQLDDDQPAGTRSNGPYFWRYMKWLRDVLIRDGVSLPMVLNPEATTIPSLGDEAAGSPHFWVMNQWYQRFYGLDLSTASLMFLEPRVQTLKMSPEFPPAVVEFSAGFFGLEDNPYGMPARPSNTLAASRVLLQNGLKGIVYFPLQDSLYPAGYEIPSTNPYYAWESALDVGGKKGPKARYVERNGRLVRTFGSLLAASHEWADVGVIDPLHAMDFAHLSTSAAAAVDAELGDLERRLIDEQIASDWVDPQAQPLEQMLRYPVLLQPAVADMALLPQAWQRLLEYAAHGGKLIELDGASRHPRASGGPYMDSRLRGNDDTIKTIAGMASAKVKSGRWIYGSELVSDSGSLALGKRDARAENYGMVLLTNPSGKPITTDISAADPYDSQKTIPFGPTIIPAKDSVALPLRIRLGALLGESPVFLRDTDEIYFATAELNEASSADSLRLGFYAPAPARVALRLAEFPKTVFLNGRKFSGYELDPAAHELTVRLPAGNAPDYQQTLELSYAPAEKGRLGKIPSPSSSTAQTEVFPVRCEFPSRIDYQIRPDVTLPSFPVLVLAQAEPGITVPLTLENISNGSQSLTLRWDFKDFQSKSYGAAQALPGVYLEESEHGQTANGDSGSPGVTVHLEPKETKRLNVAADPSANFKADAPLCPAALILESGASRQSIPIRLLRVPPHWAVSYAFDFDRDGNPEYVLENALLRVAISPASGGRITQMVLKESGTNIAAPAGLLRDTFALMAPLDAAWGDEKLPDWTRSRAPGLKNRAYAVAGVSHAAGKQSVTLVYRAPDVFPQGAEIRKTVSLAPDDPGVSVHYEIRVSSGDPGQEFRVHDVIFLDPNAHLWYGQNGVIYKESLDNDLSRNSEFSDLSRQSATESRGKKKGAASSAVRSFQPDWIGIGNSKSDWTEEWSTATSVNLSAEKNYAVLEIGLGRTPLADKTYAFDLRYRYGPGVLRSMPKKRPDSKAP